MVIYKENFIKNFWHEAICSPMNVTTATSPIAIASSLQQKNLSLTENFRAI
jgi:hypothetical protein